MAFAEEAEDEAVDQCLLADDDFRDFGAQRGDPGGVLRDLFVELLCIHGWQDSWNG